MFLLQRASDRRNLHSAGISRFSAKPVPIPGDKFIRRTPFTSIRRFPGRLLHLRETYLPPGCSSVVVRLDAVWDPGASVDTRL